jgi:hypothetical protein
MEMNAEWDRHRRGLPPAGPRLGFPLGSIGDAYHRATMMRAKDRQRKGINWTSEQRSRDDWPRAWKHIEFLADCDPKTVTGDMLLELRSEVAAKISESEAHRVIKVWRALWRKMVIFGFCAAGRDPSLLFANSAPKPRQAVWREGEAVRLVKTAWRSGYRGLATLLAVGWDSQLSPVDARRLSAAQMRQDRLGVWFEVARAKTGRTALATLGKRSATILEAYLAGTSAQPIGVAPIFRNRSGRPYSKDTLGDDFRDVRTAVFGTGETRQLADFRRSGSTEALAGGVDPAKLSTKMANSLSTSNRLHKTYSPIMLASVRETDAARAQGRARLREQEGDKSIRAPVGKYPRSKEGGAK